MAETGSANAARGNEQTRRETSDADVRAIGFMAAGLAVFVIASILMLGAVFRDATRAADKGLSALPPEPRLQTDPAADLRRFNAAAAERLVSYGYLDRARGLAHIPIEQAMRRVAEQGIPDWPGPPR